MVAAVQRTRLRLSVCCPIQAPLLDHLQSTLVAGVEVSATRGSSTPDVWWLPPGAPPTPRALADADAGAVVIAHSPEALGLPAAPPIPVSHCSFPEVSGPLLGLQRVLSRILYAIQPSVTLAFGETAAVLGAAADEVIISGPHGPCCAVLRRGRGLLLLLGVFPLGEGTGFRVERHLPLRSAATQLIVDEVLAWAFRARHGVAVRKLLGPWGAPMLAWQAHVEEFGGVHNRALDHFTCRLASSRQVPTFSLIRNLFHWGRRTPGLVSFRLSPLRAQPLGAAYFSGAWVRQTNGAELGFESDPRFIQYYEQTPGQQRVYPSPTPDGGLALGSPSGRIELYSAHEVDGQLALAHQGPFKLADGTVPTFAGPAPTFGPAVGGRPAQLFVCEDSGRAHRFELGPGGWEPREQRELGARVSPRFVDWKGTGGLDLLIGNEDGRVEVVENFTTLDDLRRVTVAAMDKLRVAPCLLEGKLVAGDHYGRVWQWAGGRAELLPSEDTSVMGVKSPYLQQDAVPVVLTIGGREWLVVGASIMGAPSSIAAPAIASVLQETLERLEPLGPTFSAHLALGPQDDLVQVSRELDRHRAAFEKIGLRWVGTGADQHCWWVPPGELSSVFLLQRNSGLHFNFGWQPPGVAGSPDGDAAFGLNFPFLLRHEGATVDFVLHNPVQPNNWPIAQTLATEFGLPVISFTHPEHRALGTAALELDRWLEALQLRRDRAHAVFVTEQQMAQALAGVLSSCIELSRDARGLLHIAADRREVPTWAAAYARTLAVSVEGASESDAQVSFLRDQLLVVGVGDGVCVGEGTSRGRKVWPLRAANGPLELAADELTISTPGFQEFLMDAEVEVTWPGSHRRELAAGVCAYSRFGDPVPARLAWRPAAPRLDLGWSAHPSQQDRWVVEKVFDRRPPVKGYFVELGAADGVSSSATLALERGLGWTGIVVEPNDAFFEQLRRNRKCRAENACIAERSGFTDFVQASWYGRIYEHVASTLPGGKLDADPYLQKDVGGGPARITRKRALSLEALLQKHRAPRRIDFVSIDAEFSEWFILRSFPFHKFEILSLCVHSKFGHEGALIDGEHAARIRDHMIGWGYFYDREHSRALQHDFFIHPRLVSSPLTPTMSSSTRLERAGKRVLRAIRGLSSPLDDGL